MPFNFRDIVARLENQRSAIDRALAVLREFDGDVPEKPAKKVGAKKTPTKKRTMSAAGRKAIGDAVRKRWAAKKKTGAKKIA